MNVSVERDDTINSLWYVVLENQGETMQMGAFANVDRAILYADCLSNILKVKAKYVYSG